MEGANSIGCTLESISQLSWGRGPGRLHLGIGHLEPIQIRAVDETRVL
jgi:hypothetical protein